MCLDIIKMYSELGRSYELPDTGCEDLGHRSQLGPTLGSPSPAPTLALLSLIHHTLHMYLLRTKTNRSPIVSFSGGHE